MSAAAALTEPAPAADGGVPVLGQAAVPAETATYEVPPVQYVVQDPQMVTYTQPQPVQYVVQEPQVMAYTQQPVQYVAPDPQPLTYAQVQPVSYVTSQTVE